MNDIKERIKHLVSTICDGNTSEFSRIVGLNETTIRNYITGKSSPKHEMLAKITITFNVNPGWILLGEGEMLRDAPPKSEPTTIELLQTKIQSLEKEVTLKDEIIYLLKEKQQA